MAQLQVALQEGFEGETVVIRVAGREVFRKDNVTTKLQIGFAESFEMNVEEGSVNLEIALPAKALSKAIDLQAKNTIYVGVSIIAGQVAYRISQDPFGYV